MSEPRHLAHGEHGTKGIAHMRDGDDLCAIAELRFKILDPHIAIIANGHNDDLCAGSPREELPRDDIAMVLKPGEQNLIALFDAIEAIAMGDEVDALGRAFCIDNLGA